MNRFKKEIRKRGIKLEADFPFLPFEGIEAVHVDSERATISTYYNFLGWVTNRVCSDLSIKEIEWATDRLFG